MNKIEKYTYSLQLLLSFVGIPLIVGTFFYKWFWRGTETFNSIKYSAMTTAGVKVWGKPIFIAHQKVDPFLRLVVTLVDSISIILLISGCIYLIKLFSRFNKGELFSKEVTQLFGRVLWIALSWTIYNPINYILLSLLTTINNRPGQRVLSFSLKGSDIVNIFIVGSFLVINVLMQEAHKLKQEQDLTV